MNADELLENISAGVEIIPTEYDLTNNRVLYQLGYYYELTNIDQAIKFYKMAVDAGHKRAPNNLGFIYRTQLNYDLAIYYYKIAVAHGSEMALRNLGMIYTDLKEYTIAIYYFKLALHVANRDDTKHQFMKYIYKLYELQNRHNILTQYCI